jgi:thiol-disulfide isomerase/thioredoxin
MLGQVYLMDFWAVWCAPCVAEMPYLHAAYEKYKEDGFTILSLSFDQKPQDVIEYREAGAWKMPWRHAFVEGGFASELAKSFQVVGIPKPILIGADGLILATFADLNGPALDRTLAGVFGREPTASEERKQ